MNSFLSVKLSVQERWRDILGAWAFYKASPEQQDALLTSSLALKDGDSC